LTAKPRTSRARSTILLPGHRGEATKARRALARSLEEIGSGESAQRVIGSKYRGRRNRALDDPSGMRIMVEVEDFSRKWKSSGPWSAIADPERVLSSATGTALLGRVSRERSPPAVVSPP